MANILIRAGKPALLALNQNAIGHVASVHRRAVNLLIDNGPLLGLLPRDRPIHPWAATTTLPMSAFSEGQPFGVSDSTLTTGGHDIDFSTLVSVDLCLHERPPTLPPGLSELLRSVAGPTSAADRFSARIEAVLEEVRTTGDIFRLAALLGVGSGYTPSGDDVIVGALAALDLRRDVDEQSSNARQRLVDALPNDLETHTPRLSAQLIRAACNGRYAEPILDLLRAIATGSKHDILASANALTDLGHQSGRDTLRGLSILPDESLQRQVSAPPPLQQTIDQQ